MGGESGFRGIADLLTDTAIIYDGGRSQTGPIPDDLAATEHEVREQLVEGIVVGDDDLMERYLDGDIPSSVELEATLASGVAQGVVFPVVCGSAVTGVGVDRLATLLAEIAPAPDERPPVEVMAGDTIQEVTCDPAGQPLARVFKTISDPYVGKISLMRVQSGTIRPDSVLTNPRTHSDERLHVLQLLQGKEAKPAEPGRGGRHRGGAQARRRRPPATRWRPRAPRSTFRPSPPNRSRLSVAIKPKSKGDEDKLMTGLHRLQEEDPALLVERVDETHQTILRGTGETHLAVAAERLARKFGVEVATEEVLIPYRESITVQAEAEGKYKKQSGGHGQFGVASIRIEPLERGEGFQFVDKVVGGAIPRQYIPAVEKGIIEAMKQGGVYGYPVVDLRVVCLDGKHHPVDSSEMSFKMAGSLAFKEAMAKAGPVLLEPISLLEVIVPGQHAGERARRSQFAPREGAGHRHGPDERPEDHRAGAHGRDPALRNRPSVPDRRPRPVSG